MLTAQLISHRIVKLNQFGQKEPKLLKSFDISFTEISQMFSTNYSLIMSSNKFENAALFSKTLP